jgi:hypothetical protein
MFVWPPRLTFYLHDWTLFFVKEILLLHLLALFFCFPYSLILVTKSTFKTKQENISEYWRYNFEFSLTKSYIFNNIKIQFLSLTYYVIFIGLVFSFSSFCLCHFKVTKIHFPLEQLFVHFHLISYLRGLTFTFS